MEGKDVEAVIREYIDQYEDEQQVDLVAVYQAIQAVLTDEEECISWGMPTFGKNVIHFAGAKKHVGIYPGPDAVKHFARVLDEKKYKHSKGAIQMPYGKVDLALVTAITEYCRDHR